MAEHNNTGTLGEILARKYLEESGYKIIYKNFRYRRGEIDIIAEKDRTLIFVEVKTRSGYDYGEPEAFVSKKQANMIIDAADHYIHQNDWLHDIRFDIISVGVKPKVNIYHIEDAFH